MIRMLSNEEARGLFQTARVARLGCVVNGEPYVVPVNCHLEGDRLYSHSLSGLKISGLRENPRACIQVDQIESDLHWRSAIAFGKYEEITKSTERADVLKNYSAAFPCSRRSSPRSRLTAARRKWWSSASTLNVSPEFRKDR